jgi:hypothetical protein
MRHCGSGCERWPMSVGASATGAARPAATGGFTANHNCLFRLYREERLMVRRRGGRKQAAIQGGILLSKTTRNSRPSELALDVALD